LGPPLDHHIIDLEVFRSIQTHTHTHTHTHTWRGLFWDSHRLDVHYPAYGDWIEIYLTWLYI